MVNLATRFRHRLSACVSDARGEVYVEYAVLAALAVLVILGAVQFFFGGVADVFTRLGDALRGLG